MARRASSNVGPVTVSEPPSTGQLTCPERILPVKKMAPALDWPPGKLAPGDGYVGAATGGAGGWVGVAGGASGVLNDTP